MSARGWVVLGLWCSLLAASACFGALVANWAAAGLAASLASALVLLLAVDPARRPPAAVRRPGDPPPPSFLHRRKAG